MKRYPLILLVILLGGSFALAAWHNVPTTVTSLTTAYVWGETPLAEVDVAILADNIARAQYIRAAATRQYKLIELYETGEVTIQGYTFTATPQTITAIKQEFAALRTRMKACQDLVTAN